MEVIKWVFALAVGLVVAATGIVVAISAMLFSIVTGLISTLVLFGGGIAIMIKEKIDERNDK